MNAIVRGWARAPHDVEPTEDACFCAWCGRDAEDGADVDATREEAENCLPQVSLDHYGKIRLCDECNDQRIASWESDDISSALDGVSEVMGVDPGIHPTERGRLLAAMAKDLIQFRDQLVALAAKAKKGAHA